jgi:hypothetical protein
MGKQLDLMVKRLIVSMTFGQVLSELQFPHLQGRDDKNNNSFFEGWL